MSIEKNSPIAEPRVNYISTQQQDSVSIINTKPMARKGAELISYQASIESSNQNNKTQNFPEIDEPLMNPDTAMVLLSVALDNAGNVDIKVSLNTLNRTLKKNEDLNKDRLKKLEDQIAKTLETAKKQKAQQAGSDIGLGFSTAAAVFGLIGSIFLAILSFGAAGPAVAAAVIGLVTVSMDIADRAVQGANNGQGIKISTVNGKEAQLEISFAGMVKRIVEQQEKDGTLIIPKGLNPEEREAYKDKLIMAMTIWVSIVVAASTVFLGGLSIGAAANAAKNIALNGAKLAEKIMSAVGEIVSKVSEAAQAVAQIGEAISSITSASYGIQLENIKFDQKMLDNQKARIEVWIKILSGEISMQQDHIKEKIENTKNLFENLSLSISNYNFSASKNFKMS